MAVIKLKQSKLDELNDKGILYNQSHTSTKVQETKPLLNLPVRETAKPSTNAKVAAIDAKIAENRAAIKAVQNSDLDDYNKKLEIAKLNTNHSQLVQEKIAADPNLVDRLWAGFGNIITTSAGGMTAAAEVAKDVIKREGKSTGYDPNSRSAQYLDYANKAKETALAGTSGAGRFLGETALSIGQTLSTLPLSAINPALPMLAMGTTAGGTKAAEVKQQGGTSNEALIRGTVSGAIEGLTEAIPVANLFKLAKSGGTSAVKSVLKQAGIEATEEGISYMLNLGADKIAKDPNAKFSLKELATAVGMGALSGGIMGTGAVGVSKVNGSNVATPEAAAKATPNREVQYLPIMETAQDATEMAQEIVSDNMGKKTPQTDNVVSSDDTGADGTAVSESVKNTILDRLNDGKTSYSGWRVSIYRDTNNDGATVTVYKKDGEKIKRRVSGGRYWSRSDLNEVAAEMLAERFGEIGTTNTTNRINPNESFDHQIETLPIRERTVEPLPTVERQTGKVNPDDSVGAAPLGFTGDTERGYSKNLGSDKARHEDIQHEYQVNPQMYFRLANKDTLAKATAIMDTGLESAKSELDKALGAAQSGMKFAPEMVPLSKMVADKLAAEGRMDEAERILSSVAVELTQAGQLGQAAIILRDSSPTAKISTLEKAIAKINEEGRNRYKNKWKDLALTDAEKAEAANIKPGDEEAFTALYEKVAKRLGSEIPSTMWEKLSEVRRVFMLLNPKTQFRNFFGNAPLMAARKTAEKISGAVQDVAVKAGWLDKEKQTRTRKVSTESKELAKQLFEQQKDSLSGAAEKWDVNGMIQQYRKYFGDSGVGKAADAVREFTYKLLEAGDHPFLKSAFVDSAAQYIEAHGIKDLTEMKQEGIDFATQQAMEATFRDFSVVASTLNKLKKQGVGGAALDILFPFTTTPINVTKRTIEYSPAGLLSLFSNNKDSAQKIDAVAKSLTGTGVIILGVLLAKYGLATAGADENKDKAALDKATGTSPYSIAGKVSYEWAQPIGTQLAMGAAAWDASKNGGNGFEALWEAIKAGGDVVMDMTIFSNIKDLFSGYGSPTETIIDTLTSGVASQMTPSLLGAAARIIDPTVRTSSYNEGALENVKTSALAKIPGASKTLPALINVKGEETKRVDNPFLRALQEGFNPANVNTGERNAVDNEVYRLYEETGELSVFPQKVKNSIEYNNTTVNLKAKDKMQYQQTLGQTYYSLVDAMMDSPIYKQASTEEQVEYLKMAESYASQAAKEGVIGSAFKPEKFYENAQKAKDELGISEAEFLLRYEKYGGSAMNSDKVRDAYDAGLDIDTYLDYKANKKLYDSDANGSYTIAETNAAIKDSGMSEDDQIKAWLIEKPDWADKASEIGVSVSSFVKYKVATMGFEGKQAQPKIYQAINTLDIPESDRTALRRAKATGAIN